MDKNTGGSNSITDMVNDTIKQYQQSLKQSAQNMQSTKNNSGGQNTPVQQNPARPELYAKLGNERVKNAILIVFGGIILFFMVMSLMAAQLVHILVGHGNGSWITALIGAVIGAVMVYLGVQGFGMISRFKKYVQVLGDKTYCDFQTLAKAVARPVDFVKKDITKMIRKNWFLEGHIDKEQTCLITSRETYQQYQITQNSVEQKKAEKAKEDAQKQKLSPEVQEVLNKGEEYLEQIRKCNDAIPGEEMSAKISQMEKVVDQILDRVKEHPDSVPDMKKLMNYYLPTAIKILNTYADMDKQSVQGDTIQASKKEIESSLDTLNNAFARLLDTAFQGTALDVSSDISVLNTLLAQEGLTGSDFDNNKKGE